MIIYDVAINHFENPIGRELNGVHVSYKVKDAEGKRQKAARIVVSATEDMKTVLYDSGKSETLSSLNTTIPITLTARTVYYVQVEVWSDKEEYAVSDTAFFETAKLDEPWSARWICSPLEKDSPPVFTKTFSVESKKKARLYITGLGLYRAILNGKRIGNDYLTPGCTNYADWIQYQTYDVTDLLCSGKEQVLEVQLSDGWYKGRFGIDGKREIYGSSYALIAELHVEKSDGTEQVVATDDSWLVKKSEICSPSLYDGELFAPAHNSIEATAVFADKPLGLLVPQTTDPVRIECTLKPKEIIHTPNNEVVLDFGQNMAGFVRFSLRVPAGEKVKLSYGEILQHGNFYRDNLRTAKAEYTYVSDGEARLVEPSFSYYGFRYVKVESAFNIEESELLQFEACVIHSEMKQSGSVYTANEKVNRLIQNAEWGQRSNFVDVPTDCPQRDERMGWTGDTQVFSRTALFQTDCYTFYRKYVKDMATEQKHRNGDVPNVIPSFTMAGGNAVWGDAATIIPWNVYLFYGDTTILSEQYESMKSWVDFIHGIDEENGGTRLWRSGFQFGDWLALDSETGGGVKGGTDDTYIATTYYYYSATLVSKTARLLGNEQDAEKYSQLAKEILAAIKNEYFTPNGRLAVTTQTGYVLCLAFHLAPNEKAMKLAADMLASKIKQNNNHLKTGFTGTPFLCSVLSEYGYNDLAYTLLLNEECPGWLYEVNMGATTIWERWNSVLPDGSISDTGMNSLNHYAYGSIVEWLYRTVGGLNPVAEKPGFKKAVIQPRLNYRMRKADVVYDSAAGTYEVHWYVRNDGSVKLEVKVPFDAEAEVYLPGKNDTVPILVASGTYVFEYKPDVAILMTYSIDSPIVDLIENKVCADLLRQYGIIPESIPAPLREANLAALKEMPFAHLEDDKRSELAEKLRSVN